MLKLLILGGVLVMLLMKPQNNHCFTWGCFFWGDGPCDCLIFFLTWNTGALTCLAPHQWIITWERRDVGKTTLVTMIGKKKKKKIWPNLSNSLACPEPYLVLSGNQWAPPSRLSSGAMSGGQHAHIWPR